MGKRTPCKHWCSPKHCQRHNRPMGWHHNWSYPIGFNFGNMHCHIAWDFITILLSVLISSWLTRSNRPDQTVTWLFLHCYFDDPLFFFLFHQCSCFIPLLFLRCPFVVHLLFLFVPSFAFLCFTDLLWPCLLKHGPVQTQSSIVTFVQLQYYKY